MKLSAASMPSRIHRFSGHTAADPAYCSQKAANRLDASGVKEKEGAPREVCLRDGGCVRLAAVRVSNRYICSKQESAARQMCRKGEKKRTALHSHSDGARAQNSYLYTFQRVSFFLDESKTKSVKLQRARATTTAVSVLVGAHRSVDVQPGHESCVVGRSVVVVVVVSLLS